MKETLAIKKVKNKGRGVFANRRIPRGEIIQTAAVHVLSPREEKVIADLPLQSHVFNWGTKGDKTAILFGHGSMFNHSYTPNASFSMHLKKEQIVFRAVKNINKGEEITFNYGGVGSKDPITFTKKGWSM